MVAAISVTVDKNLLGTGAGLRLGLPRTWPLAEENKSQSTLTLAGRVHTPRKISASSAGDSVLYFDDILNLETVLSMPQGLELCFDLATEHFPIHLRGRLVLMDGAEAAALAGAKTNLNAAMEKAGGYLVKKAQALGLEKVGGYLEKKAQAFGKPKELVVVLDEIRTADAHMRLDAGQVLAPPTLT
jgi:hypothetical protein